MHLSNFQVPSSRQDSTEEDEEIQQVMLFWDDRKKEKSVHDLVYDRQPEDQEILSYYRFRVHQILLEQCFATTGVLWNLRVLPVASKGSAVDCPRIAQYWFT